MLELVQMEAEIPWFENVGWKTSKLLLMQNTIVYFQFFTLGRNRFVVSVNT